MLFFLSLLTAQTKEFFSEGYFIEKYTAQDGLPGNSVKDIILGQNGFLWMATHNGLVRYDGYDFEVFLMDTTQINESYNNFIYALHQDSSGLIWAGTLNEGLYLFDPQNEKVLKHFFYEKNNPRSLASNWVRYINEDVNNNIWVSSLSGISMVQQTDSIIHFFKKDSSVAYEPAHHVDKNNYVLSTLGGTPLNFQNASNLWFYDPDGIDVIENLNSKPKFSSSNLPQDIGNGFKFSRIDCLLERGDGQLWVAAQYFNQNRDVQNIIGIWNPGDNEFLSVHQDIPSDSRISQLYEDDWGNLWIGTWGRGLFVLKNAASNDHWSGLNAHLDYIFLDSKEALETGNIWKLLPDQYGNLWVGTWRGHLYKINLSSYKEAYLQIKKDDKSFFQPGYMVEGENGNLWFTTNENRLYQQAASSGKITQIEIPIPNTSRTIDTPLPLIKGVGDELWIGTYHGIIQYIIGQNTYRIFPLERADKTLGKDWVNVLTYSQEKGLFCGTSKGSIYWFDLSKQSFEALHEEYTNLGVINDLLLSSDNFLIASTNRGLHKIDIGQPERKSFVEINGGALDVFESTDRNLWLTSYLGGISILDRNLAVLKNFRSYEDINLEWTTGVLEDRQKNIWFISPEGMIRYTPDKETFKTFTQLNLFPMLKIGSLTGFFTSKRGLFYIAGEEGIFRFNPQKITASKNVPIPVIKNILIHNKAIDQHSAYQDYLSASYLESLRLFYRDNDLTIEYAGIQYDYPDLVKYRYKLEGLHEDWVEVGVERTARFPNLSPGSYTFKLQAKNGDGVWNEKKAYLAIAVLPPWWRTSIAYGFYVFTILFLTYLMYQYQLNRRLALAEAQRLREIDELKSRLYTNITHEFRTPLTVIQGMAEKARAFFREKSAKKFENAINSIQRNSKQLLQLINQLLDLSKLESGALKLNLIQGDVINYLNYLAESFESYAQFKEIKMISYNEENSLVMDFDPDKLRDVVSNLLSNAIKFTPNGGKIIFHVKKEQRGQDNLLILQIKDTGIGISSDKLPYIFDRFYQVDNTGTREGEGTGIGLAHTQELINLMQGKIEVESQINEGSTFKIFLPISQTAEITNFEFPKLEVNTLQIEENESSKLISLIKEDLSTILIVEDNLDVQNYLENCLEGRYQLFLSNNGEEGIQKALDLIPDLIISDVMMPKKNGFELCRTLKKNERTSHIPIILLTAKADDESRIGGFEMGADAYLIKPFNEKELFVRLQQLIKLRKRLQDRYQNVQPISLIKGNLEYAEDKFISKIQVVLESNLGNEDFGVSRLADEVGMSRSQLFKKIKALTGKSVAQYIRSYRLIRAKQILENSALSISEVAYTVGFKDPAYFSRVYSDEFGYAPSETRKYL